MKGPEAFIPDAASNLLSTEPLVNVSFEVALFASNAIDCRTGKHNNDGSHQLFMRNA
jgi:hypothetical protein